MVKASYTDVIEPALELCMKGDERNTLNTTLNQR